MKKHRFLYFGLTLFWVPILLLAHMVSGGAADAQSPLLSTYLDGGRQALLTEDFETASNNFLKGSELASQEGDSHSRSRFLFYLGLTQQQQANLVTDASMKADLLYKAMVNYQIANQLRPNSGPILNNLASVHEQRGELDLAEQTLLQAIDLNDNMHGFYLANYADFLSEAGNWKKAAEKYSESLAVQPENEQTFQKLLKLYLTYDRSRVGGCLWQEIERGQVLTAQSSALDLLEGKEMSDRELEESSAVTGDWNSDAREEFLTVVVVSLGKQYYDPLAFLQTDIAKRLKSLADDDLIGEAVSQVLLLHEGANFGHREYGWWAQRIQSFAEAPDEIGPLEGFRRLARSLGNWFQRSEEDYARARKYYELAVLLNEREPDPKALLDLLAAHLNDGPSPEIEQLQSEYESQQSRWKTRKYNTPTDYRNSRLLEIYEYHYLLGAIYSLMNNWGDSVTRASAIFQLEHAVRAAQLYKENEPEVLWIPDQNLADLLVQGYQKTGESPRYLPELKKVMQ